MKAGKPPSGLGETICLACGRKFMPDPDGEIIQANVDGEVIGYGCPGCYRPDDTVNERILQTMKDGSGEVAAKLREAAASLGEDDPQWGSISDDAEKFDRLSKTGEVNSLNEPPVSYKDANGQETSLRDQVEPLLAKHGV